MTELATEFKGVPEVNDAGEQIIKPVFTLRSPGEFMSMEFDDTDIILGDRLMATGQPFVMAAAGGTGKSRLLLQLIACVVSGRDFLKFKTGGRDKRWLVLQTENSNRRLQRDLTPLRRWLGEDDWQRFCDQVVIHAVESEIDSFVSLENPENVLNIEGAIEAAHPDIIAIDPLSEFGMGDLNTDVAMRQTCQILTRISRRGNPERAICTLHHALTGKGGAAKATGYDRSSFARSSKALHSWTRGQMNIAPVDPDSNDRLIFACGKCSNGKEFETFAAKLNLDTMIYEVDETVNLAEWQSEISGREEKTVITRDMVADLCKPAMTRIELSKAIMTRHGCAKATAYRHIEKADGKTITFNKTQETFNKK